MTGWAVWVPPGADMQPWVRASSDHLVARVGEGNVVTSTVSDAPGALALLGTGAVGGLLVPDWTLLEPLVLEYNPRYPDRARADRPRWGVRAVEAGSRPGWTRVAYPSTGV